jgi:hypothetical protein
MENLAGHRITFEIITLVERPERVTAVFPLYMTLQDSSEDGSSWWEFHVRVKLIGTTQARVDFIKISDDGYELSTEVRILARLSEFFRKNNNYKRYTSEEFHAALAKLRRAMDDVSK